MDQQRPEIETAINTIKERIVQGDLKAAIGLLKSLGIHKEVYNLEARYNRLQSANIKGTLSQSEYHLELNRISDALLELVNCKVQPPKTNRAILYVSLGILAVVALAYFMLQPIQSEERLNLAEKDGKYGFVDENGTVVIPFEYDNAQEFVDSTARVGKGAFLWTINKKGKCVLDCDNMEKYENARTTEQNLEQILKQIEDLKGQLEESYEAHVDLLGKDVLLGNAEKEDMLSLVNRIQELHQVVRGLDSLVASRSVKTFWNYWGSIQRKLDEAYLPNPNEWYEIQFPEFKKNYIAVDDLAEGQLLRVRDKPFKKSLAVFQFVPVENSPKNWYQIKTYSNYYWHTFKRPSHYTDSGIELKSSIDRSKLQAFTYSINNIGNGRITITSEGHDGSAAGGRSQGVISISQQGNNGRPDGSPLHLWEYLRGGDQKLKIVQVEDR